MKTQTTETSARVQAYSFDNDTLKFTIDHGIVKEAVKLDESLVDSLIAISLKTLIHRSSSRPKSEGDATEWLLEALKGGEAGGRFRVTSKDKERAASTFKAHGMAPEQTEKLFLDTYGFSMEATLEWLETHYMRVRAAAAAAEKAKNSMI